MDEDRNLQQTMDTPFELLSRTLNAAASIKKREDQLRRTTRDLSHASCEVHWGWRRDFRTFIL